MKKVDVTVIVPVLNESRNIQRCLASLEPAECVLVVDSGSVDGTDQVASGYGAEVLRFEYSGGYPKKRQWVLDNWKFRTSWILLVDADERVTDELWKEIDAAVCSRSSFVAYTIRKDFCFLGRRLRWGGFSHSAVSLFLVGAAHFEELTEVECGLDMEVHERILVQGNVGALRFGVEHWDSRGLDHYLSKHNHYSTWDAGARSVILSSSLRDCVANFSGVQRLRRMLKWFAVRIPGEPFLWFGYHYLVCLGLLEGRRGLIASRIRASYIADVRDKVWEARNVPAKAGVDAVKGSEVVSK
jgi:glycosyltransferase involved in cell wall biosynthesis